MMELRDVTRRFGETAVLHGVSLSVAEGSFTSLLGPSGCGKSTTLRIMAGLDRPTSGSVLMDGRDVGELTPAERNIAMVFQSYALYPHLTVRENIALPLAMRGMSRLERAPLFDRLLPSARAKSADIGRRVGAIAEMLGIEKLLDRKPAQLSGGQKQRVAVGRALVRDPALFLLDEPLSNLDATLRVQMRAELAALHRRTGKSFVYVTHDQVEAMSMSDTVAVVLGGRIAQLGAPRELYERPANRAVAAFIGAQPINLVDVVIGGTGTLSGPFAACRIAGRAPAGPALLGIRPEHLAPVEGGPIEARLESVEYLGAEVLLHVVLADGTRVRALAPGAWHPPAPGAVIALGFEAANTHLFDATSGVRRDLDLARAAA